MKILFIWLFFQLWPHPLPLSFPAYTSSNWRSKQKCVTLYLLFKCTLFAIIHLDYFKSLTVTPLDINHRFYIWRSCFNKKAFYWVAGISAAPVDVISGFPLLSMACIWTTALSNSLRLYLSLNGLLCADLQYMRQITLLLLYLCAALFSTRN